MGIAIIQAMFMVVILTHIQDAGVSLFVCLEKKMNIFIIKILVSKSFNTIPAFLLFI